MSQPGDQASAAWVNYGQVRASHADREQLIGVLKAAFVQGRLTKDEFDTRVSQAFAGRTYTELAAIAADIPAGPIAVQPARQAAGRDAGQDAGRARNPADEAVAWSVGATFVAVILVVSTLLDPRDFLLVAGIISAIVFATGAQLLYSRQQRRSRGQLLPGDPARSR
jgi:hypothetical protein